MVATGSRAFVPPFAGLDTVPEKFTFMSLDDALELEKALGKDKSVLIVGAGSDRLKVRRGHLRQGQTEHRRRYGAPVLSSILDDDRRLGSGNARRKGDFPASRLLHQGFRKTISPRRIKTIFP
jgi:hypothetical protein